MRRALFVVIGLLIGAAQAGSQENRKDEAPPDVRDAIRRGADYLKKHYVAGKGWDQALAPTLPGYEGGPTGLACLALLEAGENPDEGVLRQGLEYLRGVKTRKT